MFLDMDQSLREMGVGDLSVGKRVKEMGKAFLGRLQVYESVIEVKDTKPKPAARNPRTGEVVYVPARRKPHFKPGKQLKEALHNVRPQPVAEQQAPAVEVPSAAPAVSSSDGSPGGSSWSQ